MSNKLKTNDGKYWVGDNINPSDFLLIKARMHGFGDDDVTFVVAKSELDKIPNSSTWSIKDKAEAFVEVKDDMSDEYQYSYVGVVTDPTEVKNYVKGYNHSVYTISPIKNFAHKDEYGALYEHGFSINSDYFAEGGKAGDRMEKLKAEILMFDTYQFGGRKALGNKNPNRFAPSELKNKKSRVQEIFKHYQDKGYSTTEINEALGALKYADGGQPRGLKGNNFSDKIENGQKFKRLINETFNRQTSEHKYPEEFIRAIALTDKPIVKNNGSLYVKGYTYSGTLSHFEFMDLPSFKDALDYVDRPKPQNFKFENGGEVGVGGTMDTSMSDAPMIGGTMASSMYANGGGVRGGRNKHTESLEFLKKQGYLVVLLDKWDVQGLYNVDNDVAFRILEKVTEKLLPWELVKKTIHQVAQADFGLKTDDKYAKGGGVRSGRNKHTESLEFLKKQGYLVVLLDKWDVQGLYNVDNDVAFRILEKVTEKLLPWELVKKTIHQVAQADFGLKTDEKYAVGGKFSLTDEDEEWYDKQTLEYRKKTEEDRKATHSHYYKLYNDEFTKWWYDMGGREQALKKYKTDDDYIAWKSAFEDFIVEKEGGKYAKGGEVKKYEYVPHAFIYRELDDPNFTAERYTPEEVEYFIEDFNNDMGTDYANWEDFNKGEEYRNFEAIMIRQRIFAQGGSVANLSYDKYVDEMYKQYKKAGYDTTEAYDTAFRDLGIELQGRFDKKHFDEMLMKRGAPMKKAWNEFKKFAEIYVEDGYYVNPFQTDLYAKGGSVKNDNWVYWKVEKMVDGELVTTYEKTHVASPNIPNAKEISEQEYEANKYAKGGSVFMHNVLRELLLLKDEGYETVSLNGFKESIGYVIGLDLDDTEIKKVGERSYITLYAKGGEVTNTLKKGQTITGYFNYNYTYDTYEPSFYGASIEVEGEVINDDGEWVKINWGSPIDNVDTINKRVVQGMWEQYAKGGTVKTNKRTLDKIANIYFDIYEEVGAESGSQIREDKAMLAKFAKMLDDKVSKIIAKKSLTEKDFDYYEDNNYHLLNEFLSWNDYFTTDEYKNMYKRLSQKYKRSNATLADPKYIVVKTATEVKPTSSVNETETVSGKPKYKVNAEIKSIKILTKSGRQKTIAGDMVLNGAHYFKKGGSLKADYEYLPKARVVEVTLLDGSKIKPLNGYWISKKVKFARGGGVKPFEYTEGGAKISVHGTKGDVKAMYLDYVNNFLTVGGFADYYNLSDEQARRIIELGREHAEKDGHYGEGGEVDGNTEIVIVYKELNKDGGRIYKERFLIGNSTAEEAKKIARAMWDEDWAQSDLSVVEILTDREYREKYLKPKYGDGGQVVSDVKNFFGGIGRGLKSGYEKSRDFTKKQIHDQKKSIALDVIDDTKDKVRSNRDKLELKGAEEIVEKHYAGGGKFNQDTPKVWISEWSLYNEGKLIGEWVDLSEYDSGAEVMEKIQALLDKWSAETGETREEYAVFDADNIPNSMYSEQMGEESFDNVITAWKFSQENDVPMEVVGTIVQEYAPDNLEDFFSERYVGQFDSESDLAYDYVEQMGGVANLGKNTLEMYFDYDAFGRDLAINDYNEYDGHYFRSYAQGGMFDKDLSQYMRHSKEFAKGGKVKSTKKADYEQYLNELGTPSSDHPDNGGRVTKRMVDKYGTWLRKNDPIAFEVGYNEFRHQ